MPDALRIVPPVFDEVIEDDKEGNGMQVDSGNGRDSTDTLAAGVQCLLQCLNPATADSDGELGNQTPTFPFSVVYLRLFPHRHPFP